MNMITEKKTMSSKSMIGNFYQQYKKMIIAVILIVMIFVVGEIAIGSFLSLSQVLLDL